MSARVRGQGDACIFAVRLTPKGGRDALEGWIAGAEGRMFLKARVAAPPEDGKANAALIALLAKTLGVAKSRVHLVAGETSRLKTIRIESVSAELVARIETYGGSP